MKKTSITGWKDVFTFTLRQTLKSKAFIISYIILLTMVAISMPLLSLLTSEGTATNDNISIEKVYVNNQTALPMTDFSNLAGDELLKDIIFTDLTEDYDTVANRIDETESSSVIFTLTDLDGVYQLSLARSENGSVSDNDLTYLGDALSRLFDQTRIQSLGIPEEQHTLIQSPVIIADTKSDQPSDAVYTEDTTISGSDYGFMYAILFVILMVNMMASTQIATSIVTEKSTRVIEYLLISVKPLALILGKIFAMLVAVLLQIISMVLMAFVSNKLSSIITGNNSSPLAQFLPESAFDNLTVPKIILCIICVALGIIFYAIMAGLTGATVSKLEELNEGLILFTISNIVGAYIGMGAAGSMVAAGYNAFVIFAFLFPLSSPFILPGAILTGNASFLIIAIAIVIQILSIVLIFKFVAKVFETLILHNGNRIKLKEVFKLSKSA